MHPRILLDTHILVRWLAEVKKLSREQLRTMKAAVARSESIGLSAMSLLEIGILAGDGKLQLRKSLQELFDALQSSPSLLVLPLTREIATEAGYMRKLRDPADPRSWLQGGCTA